MVKAVIFDMDGLMVDTEHLQSQSFVNVLREYGKEPVMELNGLVHKVGVRGDKNFLTMKKKYNIEADINTLRKKRRVVYEKLLEEGVNPMPGLIHLLKLLKTHNFPVAIASGSPKKHIMSIIEQIGISDYFKVIISGEDVTFSKPNPECFIKACQGLEVPAQECLVIEDAESGINGAKKIGMKVFAVPSKYTINHSLKKADKIFSSLYEITIKNIRSI